MFRQDFLAEIVSRWGSALERVFYDRQPAGSPERSSFRVVVDVAGKGLCLLEQIPSRKADRKREIAFALDRLSGAGLNTVRPYYRSLEGGHLVRAGQGYWQMRPFVQGVELDRPAYAFEAWRGADMASFLIDLRHAAAAWGDGGPEDRGFSLPAYIDGMIETVRRHDPGDLGRLERARDFLADRFIPEYDALPVGFCHGDYHPLNIIWSRAGIEAVIDWEFFGLKPELYDAANMVGCLGIEDPDSFDAECVRAFIRRLRASGGFGEQGWSLFGELVIAIRFAWMAEWLRKKDRDMVEMEAAYLDLLVDQVGRREGIFAREGT